MDDAPEVGKIYSGEICKLEAYGAFVKIPGFRRDGMIHVSEVSEARAG
jgi:polyribonucleotide nucleotidyltransferase